MQKLAAGRVTLAARGAIEHEMHGAAVGDADVGEADVRIVREQRAQGFAGTLVFRRAILFRPRELCETVAVDQACGHRREPSQIGPEVFEQDLPHDHVDYADTGNGGAPGDQAAEHGRKPALSDFVGGVP